MTRWLGALLVSVGVVFGAGLAQLVAELPTPALAVAFVALGLIVLVFAVYDELDAYQADIDRRCPGWEAIDLGDVPPAVAACQVRAVPRSRPRVFDCVADDPRLADRYRELA